MEANEPAPYKPRMFETNGPASVLMPSELESPPVPTAIVLSPMLRSRRWWRPMVRAAATIQVFGLERERGTQVLRSDLEYAVQHLSIARIVMCGEGLTSGLLPEPFLATLATVEREAARLVVDRRPPIDALWLNTGRDQFSVTGCGERSPRYVTRFTDPLLRRLFECADSGRLQ